MRVDTAGNRAQGDGHTHRRPRGKGPSVTLPGVRAGRLCVLILSMILGCLLMTTAARAGSADFQSLYDDMVQAFERRDTARLFSHYAPGYVVTDLQGQRKSLNQLRREIANNLKLFRQIRFRVRVTEVQERGQRAQVTYQSRFEGDVVADDGRRQKIVLENVYRDNWERQGVPWRVVSSQVLSERNLSPAPTPPAPGPGGRSGGGFDTAATDLAVKYANGCYARQLREFCDRLNRHVAHWMARCETQRTAHACNTANRVVEIDVGMRAANSRPRP
jgi:ketosteroid isomerase-like protein